MKIPKETVTKWQEMAQKWLGAHKSTEPADIKTGQEAWTVAHLSGITREAYEDRAIIDAHIQTALESIFPNAVFKDKKVY